MKSLNRCILMLSSLLLSGCGGSYVSGTDVLGAGAAGVAALAAYEVAPDTWSNSERAGIAAGAGVLTLIVAKVVDGKIDADQAKAYLHGYNIGVAQGARQQYEITMNLQKATEGRQQPRVKTYELPAPVKGDANYSQQNVYLEVAE